jgi:phosphoribosylaminoimidazolecarboxamide formyltransferase / IMP cyclohydrolase
MSLQKVKRALISVSDKEGAIGFARFLQSLGVEIFSTGGTGKTLEKAGIPFISMETITKNPEAFGGRMKTISFPFASSLLYRRDNEEDVAMAKKMGIEPMDLVVCNLYPFQEAKKSGASDDALVEEIDVGGPTMIRAAAKNHKHVAVVTHTSDYANVMDELKTNNGSLTLETRKHLAVKAFRLLAAYDSGIAEELGARFCGEDSHYLSLGEGKKLRYGENPHQSAHFYRDPSFGSGNSIASAEILQGKALSYNNILDADAALRSCSDAYFVLEKKYPVVAIVKHLNPCGLASGKTPLEALQLAWAGDPVSAFGGILCFSSSLTKDCAEWLSDKFVELIVAPSIEPEALSVFAKKKNMRILLCAPREMDRKEKMLRSVYGGVLVQEEDTGFDSEFRSVTSKEFPSEKIALAQFGIMACKHLRSNAIALVKEENGNFQLVGAGMGQPNRLDSIRALAGPRAKEKGGKMENLVLISDAFFPFADGIEAAYEQGIRMIVQPGGSIKDSEVIQKANELGMMMAFTGRRHFRH